MDEDLNMRCERVGLRVPRILLPRAEIDLERWSVIACDQYTSESAYWRAVEEHVGDAASTLNLILPECYLGTSEEETRREAIVATMERYLADGLLAERGEGFALVERTTAAGRRRLGLVAALDLERYDYHAGARSLIRATEGTIVERLPARMTIRRAAPIELPHVMVLYDDPESEVLGPLLRTLPTLPVCYSFNLMKGGGSLTGRWISEGEPLSAVCRGFERLLGKSGGCASQFLFAVGDGNHSLAAAKEVWNEKKRALGLSDRSDHPARYALVELVNIYDEGLIFEPIHRVLFHAAAEMMRKASSLGARFVKSGDPASVAREVERRASEQRAGWVTREGAGFVEFDGPVSPLATANVQQLIDSFLPSTPGANVDYIHGTETALRLGSEGNNLGFVLPPVRKENFFSTVDREGAFPRKMFSMGEASEKRYYLEARRIVT